MVLLATSLVCLGLTVGPLRMAAPRFGAPAIAMSLEEPPLKPPAPKLDEPETAAAPTGSPEMAALPFQSSEAPKDFVSQVPTPIITRGESKNADLPAWAEEGVVFKRAEFWDNRTATIFEILNVLGRVDATETFGERDFFIDVPPELARKEVEDNSWTRKRYDMAQRMGMVERVALQINGPSLPFTNEKLAASVGRTVEDFNAMPVSGAAIDIVFDALVESKSGLITPKELSSRRDGILNVDGDGSFNELKFRLGLYKSRGIIIASWFMFGKGNFVWILVFVQFLHDARPDLFPTPKDLDLFKIFAIL